MTTLETRRSVDATPAPAPRPNVVAGLVRSCRPRQWIKNVLVGAAPLAAGLLFSWGVLADVAIAFACFTLVASAIYLVNDVRDVAEDRRHPRKQHRPIAAGVVPPRAALTLAVVLCAAGLALSLVAGVSLTLTLAAYAGLSLGYSLWWKDQPVVDLAIVTAGFVLRAVAGGAATGIPLSQWFLLVAGFGSLFMVAGKRYSEFKEHGAEGGTRRSLHGYSASYLQFVWSLAAALSIAAYSLWALEVSTLHDGPAWETFSIAPFVVGFLRYAADIDRNAAGEPEDIVLRDRTLQAIGVIWLVTVLLGVFSA